MRLLPFNFGVRRSLFGVRRFLLLQADIGRSALGVGRFLLVAFCPFATATAQEAVSSGYGPPTSIPATRSTIAPVALPPRNWIDQTQAAADAKSIGCVQCHRGVESMHKAEQNVVLGC